MPRRQSEYTYFYWNIPTIFVCVFRLAGRALLLFLLLASKHEPDGRVILAEFETLRLLNTYVPDNGWKEEENSFQRRRKWDKKDSGVCYTIIRQAFDMVWGPECQVVNIYFPLFPFLFWVWGCWLNYFHPLCIATMQIIFVSCILLLLSPTWVKLRCLEHLVFLPFMWWAELKSNSLSFQLILMSFILIWCNY